MRVYKNLVGLREDWGGKLVLCSGPGCAQTGVPAAVNIAGGTTLAVDSDAAAMKSAMRAGILDFVVNTLDEALRTLKNEIRQERPLGVGLISNVEPALAEMVERGLQPDLQLVHFLPKMDQGMTNSQAETLCARGMPQRQVLSEDDDFDGRPVDTRQLLYHKPHDEYFFRAADSAGLRGIDATLLAGLPADDIVRRRWLERVPKYLREARSGGRWTWLSDEELESLAARGFSPVPQP